MPSAARPFPPSSARHPVKVRVALFRSRSRLALPVIVSLVLFVLAAHDAAARTRPVTESVTIAPTPLQPPAAARVDEGSTRFEIAPGSGVANVRVVVAHFPFETSGWSSVPSGTA